MGPDRALLYRIDFIEKTPHFSGVNGGVKGDDVILLDSLTRRRNRSLRGVGEDRMLNALHWAVKIGREQNTDAAKNMIEEANLIGGPTLLTALEPLLKVLPPRTALAGRTKPDTNLAGASH